MASGVSKKNFTMMQWLCLLLLVCHSVSPGQNITLAISHFQNNTTRFSYDLLEQSIPEQLKTELSLLSGITVLERSRIEDVLAEQALSQSGAIDSRQAQEVGKLLGAQFVLTGELSSADGRLRIDVHITRTETGEVFGEKATGPDASALDVMIRVLANNIKINLTGAGRRMTDVPVQHYHSAWILTAGLGAGVGAALLHSSYAKNYDLYKKADKLAEFDGPYDKANRAYQWRNVLAGSAAALLTTGFTLWLTGQSEHNKVLADSDRPVGPKYAFLPCYDFHSSFFGIQILVSR
jgi:TolB-like protein